MNETLPLRLSESVAGVGTPNAKANASVRKHHLIGRSVKYHKAHLYLPGQGDYVAGFMAKPDRFTSYSGGDEPVVCSDGLYDLPAEAWLTVNHYNALVLNSTNLLIADVDFGDERLNKYAGAQECDQVIENLEQLDLLDEEIMMFEKWSLAAQSYRVYMTHSGCRVICTSIAFPWDEKAWIARRLMQFVRADPQYIELCGVQKCYRARLTPKPWRGKCDEAHVCTLVQTVGTGYIADELEEQIRLHDELTLPDAEWSQLA